MAPVGTVYLNLQNIFWGPLKLHYPWCGFLVLIHAFLIFYEFSLYHLGCRDLFCSWAVWLEYCWHHSGRPPRFNYYFCLIALEIIHLVQNIFSQLDQITGGVLRLCSPLHWWIKVLHLTLLLPLVVVYAVTGALLLWYLILLDNLRLAYLWVLTMLRRIHTWLPGSGCVWLGSRGSDGKKLIILSGMLGNMIWGAVVSLVYCGVISVDPEYSLVCCSGMDDEEGISIIHLLSPDSL